MINKVINYSFILFCCITILLFISDTINVINNPLEYRGAQNFSTENLSLQTSSVRNYFITNILWIVGLILCFIVSVLNLKKGQNRIFIFIYYGCLILFFGAVLFGFYNWIINGFDH